MKYARIVAPAAAALAVLAAAGTAHADITGDQLFDTAMIHFAVPGAPAHLRGDAHQACSQLAAGYSLNAVGMNLYVAESPAFSVADTAHLVVAAIYSYCPTYKYEIDALPGAVS
jgi:hypothetical protein